MVKLSFSFDREDRKYYPGDVIKLEVRVQVKLDTKIRSIYARTQGYAHVDWNDTERRRIYRNDKYESYTEHVTYCSNETFFKSYQTLTGVKAGNVIEHKCY